MSMVADRLSVVASLRLRMLQIREREFDYFLTNCRAVGTLAAVLAGLLQQGLIYTKFIDNGLCDMSMGLCPEVTYPLVTCVALGTSCLTMFGSVLLITHAPAVALHGHHDRYSECVDKLERDFEAVLSLGAVSVATFVMAAILFFWSKLSQAVEVKLIEQQLEARAARHSGEGGGRAGERRHAQCTEVAFAGCDRRAPPPARRVPAQAAGSPRRAHSDGHFPPASPLPLPHLPRQGLPRGDRLLHPAPTDRGPRRASRRRPLPTPTREVVLGRIGARHVGQLPGPGLAAALRKGRPSEARPAGTHHRERRPTPNAASSSRGGGGEIPETCVSTWST